MKQSKQEKLAHARKAAEEAIRARYVEGRIQRPVLDFLVTLWARHLLLIHLQAGAASRAWKAAVETMDELLWSVKPKTDPVERQKLATTLPSLLHRLDAGLKSSGADDTSRTAFFAQLMNLHTAVLKMPHRPAAPEAVPQVRRDRTRRPRATPRKK